MSSTTLVVGLGNPGKEYMQNRHNAGRIVLEILAAAKSFSAWKEKRSLRALVSEGEMAEESFMFLLPNNYMNNSGTSVAPLITSKKKLGDLVVVYDDIDLAFGTIKISFDRTSGGHNGVESIINSVHSKEFIRVRIGICPVSADGEKKKPVGKDAVHDYLMSNFSKTELRKLEAVSEKVGESLLSIKLEGYLQAMTKFN